MGHKRTVNVMEIKQCVRCGKGSEQQVMRLVVRDLTTDGLRSTMKIPLRYVDCDTCSIPGPLCLSRESAIICWNMMQAHMLRNGVE